MPALNYVYTTPSETYTIDQFIACQSDTDINYKNLSFVDKIQYKELSRDIHYSTYNVVSDYIDELRDEYCVNVVLSDKELNQYMYRPKLLCQKIYGSGEIAYIILVINDMYSVKQFTKSNILMPRKDVMKLICKYIYNSNYTAITKYNKNLYIA
jgi:hypothetical protein